VNGSVVVVVLVEVRIDDVVVVAIVEDVVA
jgi:hypothetical protein